jgi:putative glutamine amidotransferase
MADNRTLRTPPLIALPADVRDSDGYRWHAGAESYLKAVTIGLGGIPVIVPSLADAIDIDALLGRVDGILLPGSRSNVNPELYGARADSRSEPYDRARDAMTFPLIKAAIQWGVPLFAICRGMQELNVALGGSLLAEVQELEGRSDHRAPVSDVQQERFAIRQDVDLEPGGLLAGIVGRRHVRVNSLHRQAIDRLGEGLVVEATAPDGTIEALRVADAPAFAVGVQWHPEYWVASDEPSAKLFQAFGEAVRERMRRHETALAPAEL